MTPWVMIIWMGTLAVSTSTVPFQTKKACFDAEAQLVALAKKNKNLVWGVLCVPTSVPDIAPTKAPPK